MSNKSYKIPHYKFDETKHKSKQIIINIIYYNIGNYKN